MSLLDPWYPKCIIIYGIEIHESSIIDIIQRLCQRKSAAYIDQYGRLTDDFYDNLSVGLFTDDNKYELRKYLNEYYLIIKKYVLDICTIGNSKIEISQPDITEIKTFYELVGLECKNIVVII